MHSVTYEKNGKKYARISKAKARRLFNDGVAIEMYMNNTRPGNMFVCGFSFGAVLEERNSPFARSFDQLVNAFEYYNNGYPELGKYAAFYAPID